MIENKNGKRIVMCALMVAVFAVPMFATATATASGGGTDASLDLSFIKNAVNLIVGIFAGGYVLIKAAMDIFHAVRNSDQDPNGLKKAIGGLVLNVAVLAGFMFVINYVFGAKMGAGGDVASTADAQTGFFSALSGALVKTGL